MALGLQATDYKDNLRYVTYKPVTYYQLEINIDKLLAIFESHIARNLSMSISR